MFIGIEEMPEAGLMLQRCDRRIEERGWSMIQFLEDAVHGRNADQSRSVIERKLGRTGGDVRCPGLQSTLGALFSQILEIQVFRNRDELAAVIEAEVRSTTAGTESSPEAASLFENSYRTACLAKLSCGCDSGGTSSNDPCVYCFVCSFHWNGLYR